LVKDFGPAITKGSRLDYADALCIIVLRQQRATSHHMPGQVFAQIAKDFEIDLAEAKAVYAPRAAFDPKTVAMLYVSILQRDATGKQPAKVGTASRN
jgi:hypothetical protein